VGKAATVETSGAPELAKRLDAIIGLLAYQMRGDGSTAEIMRVLSAAGLSNAEVAGHLGCTPNAVKVALYKSRKRKG
jgi:hypothetical protein